MRLWHKISGKLQTKHLSEIFSVRMDDKRTKGCGIRWCKYFLRKIKLRGLKVIQEKLLKKFILVVINFDY